MTKYIKNVNAYLSQMKIKQNFLSLKSGIDVKKLSRLLTGVQDINSTDMEKIADALGKSMDFFLTDEFGNDNAEVFAAAEVVFYAGEPTKKQEEFALNLIELIENADEVLGAKNRYMMTVGE